MPIMPEGPRLYIMIDDNQDELTLTKALFTSTFPRIEFRCESNADNIMHRLHESFRRGIAAHEIVLLIDIKMPKTNGFELIYRIRNDAETHNVRILMLSASRKHSDEDDSIAIGADGFVQKPFSVEKLEQALSGSVANSRRSRVVSHAG